MAGCNEYPGAITGCDVTISGSGSISANSGSHSACAGGVVGYNQTVIMDDSSSCTLNGNGVIKAEADGNTATVDNQTEGGTAIASEGNAHAYAGTKIGYNEDGGTDEYGPVGCTATTPAA